MAGKWSKLISQAEKLVGGPAPFINLGSVLTSEAGYLTARARRLASNIDHPFFATVRAHLRGKSLHPWISLPKFASAHDSLSSNRNQRPSGGLIILLTGQSDVSASEASTKLCNKHRSVAELFETINMAVAIHKSLVDLTHSNPTHLAACQPNVDFESWIKDMETGNKLATLAGDVLLASASTTLASYHNAQIVDIVSEAIANMVEAEFSPVSQGYIEPNLSANDQTSDAQPDLFSDLTEPARKWLDHVSLARGSLLGSCCQSAFIMSESYFEEHNMCNSSSQRPNDSKPLAPIVKQFGLNWACLTRLIDEREHIERTELETQDLQSTRAEPNDYPTTTTPTSRTSNSSHSGYAESGLAEPTLADIMILSKQSTHWDDKKSQILAEYDKLGHVLAHQLSTSYDQIASTIRIDTNHLPATLLLGQMVDQLVQEASCHC